MSKKTWRTHNPSGSRRVIVTKELPGDRWLQILTDADCKVEICTSPDILSTEEIKEAFGSRCDGAIGQLTEEWGEELFSALKAAGGKAYSNYAVGHNNVNVDAATKEGIPVGNTPGVLTETTAEMAVVLSFAAARRVVEADRFMRAGSFHGWLPTLFLGELFWRKTVGIIGAGRIGAAYARMMVEGHKMSLIYYDPYRNKALEDYVAAYGEFLKTRGEQPVSCGRAESADEVLREADLVSLHPVLDETTHHLINRERLSVMKDHAILVNTSRGPVIDEEALVAHCEKHPNFRVGLDVFEDEPAMKPGLAALDNVVVVPHIASATIWTREGMATLAAGNVAAILRGHPVWQEGDILPFLGDKPPKAAPSIVNAKELGIRIYAT
ncbi:MAG TPA: NAD(P)-dependent oxidoreductase [Desulfatiglandales bacterium]|nr:NAD(P)-dependent oxidoreductase [Desulfatiglandales bacterium]